MDYMELLQQIFQVCIIPLLGVLTAFIVAFIRKKTSELEETTDNALYKKYMEMLRDTVIDCVIATNQTYVEALKDKNAFHAEEQKQAFEMTYNAVMTILADDAKMYLETAVGDLQVYITKLIEAQVNINKTPYVNE